MKLLYCAYKKHYKSDKSYFSNGSFPDLLPELAKQFNKLYLMVPVSKNVPKNMSQLSETDQLEIIETKSYGTNYLSYVNYYFWSFFNLHLFTKSQSQSDMVLIAIPSSLPYLAFIPFINKPLIILIAGDEQEVLKSSDSVISKLKITLKMNLFNRLIERTLVNKSEIIICRSEVFKRKLISIYNLPAEKINVVTSGVKTNMFKPFNSSDKTEIRKKLGLNINSFIIGFVAAQLSYSKGIDVLLNSFYNMKKEYDNIELLLVGENVLDLQEKDSIHIYGPIKKSDLPNYYNAMDVLVFPSRSEGAPKVVMEASSCGVPVISTKVGGIPELIIENKTGFLVPVGDTDNIIKFCKILIGNEKLKNHMGINARNHGLEHFDFQILTERISDVIKKGSKCSLEQKSDEN